MSIAEPVVAPPAMDLDGDHDRFTHIVIPASAVTEAAVTGVPCTALCGKTWVPSGLPERYPVCRLCIEEFERLTNKPWAGRR